MQKSVRLLLFQPERIYFRSFAPNRGAGSQSCSLHMPRCHLLPMLLIGCAIEFCPFSQIHSSLFNSSLMEANFSDLQPLGAPRSSLFVHSHLYIFTQKNVCPEIQLLRILYDLSFKQVQDRQNCTCFKMYIRGVAGSIRIQSMN